MCYETPRLPMDTYCRSLRRRLNREVASFQKRKTIKYFQFPQRPATQACRTPDDEDQTDLFMFRTNTRLSFRPFMTPPPSRLEKHLSSDHIMIKKPERTPGLAVKVVPYVDRSPMISQNYQQFRPGTFLTSGANIRTRRMVSQNWIQSTILFLLLFFN